MVCLREASEALASGSPILRPPRRVLRVISAFFGEKRITHSYNMLRSRSKVSSPFPKSPPTAIVVCKYSAFKRPPTAIVLCKYSALKGPQTTRITPAPVPGCGKKKRCQHVGLWASLVHFNYSQRTNQYYCPPLALISMHFNATPDRQALLSKCSYFLWVLLSPCIVPFRSIFSYLGYSLRWSYSVATCSNSLEISEVKK